LVRKAGENERFPHKKEYHEKIAQECIDLMVLAKERRNQLIEIPKDEELEKVIIRF